MTPLIKHCKMMLTALAVATIAGTAYSQTLEGSNIDSRVLVGFKTNAEAVQSHMPEGWRSIGFPAGPMKGANLLVGFEDRQMALDAEGKPRPPATSRAVAILGLAKQEAGDDVRLYVLRVYTTNDAFDTYGNTVVSQITRATTSQPAEDGGQDRTDHWSLSTDDGRLEMKLAFKTGRRNWAPSKAKVFSNADPSIARLFDYTQLVDVLKSDGLGKPMAGEFEITNKLKGLSGLLDGTQDAVAIMDIPVYVRQVYIP
ncbi:hypothetical protein [Marimonas lutisalis]|uniref:hypothetical protein n=1 Tax=Marimonas lutisalis TaxID=2545756 RepID=UPI0010F84EAD|nr:hypothetical protein [Marimonas lutisalis]